MKEYLFRDIVIGDEGLLKGPFGSDLKSTLYVPKGDNTYKVYLQENILNQTLDAGNHYISEEYFRSKMYRYLVKENDFIVTCDGTLGEIYQLIGIKEKGIISSSLLRITINPEIADYDYFYYLFKHQIKKELIIQGNNSVLKHLPGVEVIRNHKVHLPDLEEQKKIGKILKDIDRKISLNNQINDELGKVIDDIYCYWFENYKFPNNSGATVYNDKIKKDIPLGWEVLPLLSLCFWETNSQPPKSEFSYEMKEGYIRFIQNRDYDSDDYITYIPKTKSLSIAGKYDILIDKYGDAGTVRYGIEGAFNVALAKIGVRNDKYLEYVRSFLSSEPVYAYLHNACMASTRASLNEESIKPLFILVPPEPIVEEFEKTIHLIREKILLNQDENRALIKTRNEIMPLLMNGQAIVG